ncbi:MAG TPA: hypothetical protein VF283_15800 [Bryobacteraceae bacterium]
MPSAEIDGFPVDSIRAEVTRIVESESFRSSKVLRDFLTFVVDAKLAGTTEKLKEYTLATEILNQPPHFDSRVNNIVRVHAHRLRERLRDYYRQEGAEALLVIDVPKGGYVPEFAAPVPPAAEPQVLAPAGVSKGEQTNRVPPGVQSNPKPGRLFWFVTSIALSIAAGFAFGWAIWSPKAGYQPSRAAPNAPQLTQFWRPFWKSSLPATIAIANRSFLLDEHGAYIPYTGPRDGLPGTYISKADAYPYADPSLLKSAGRVQFNDAITGIGEAEAVHLLTQTFVLAGHSTVLRRSHLLRVGDMQTGNIIFLGSAAGNPLLRPLNAQLDFQFRSGGIAERDASAAYCAPERDPQSGALLSDCGLIARLPGSTPNSVIAILAGVWTYGTLAAARFTTQPEGIAALLAYPGLAQSGRLPTYFEAVVSAKLVQGEVGQIRLLTVRRFGPPQRRTLFKSF